MQVLLLGGRYAGLVNVVEGHGLGFWAGRGAVPRAGGAAERRVAAGPEGQASPPGQPRRRR